MVRVRAKVRIRVSVMGYCYASNQMSYRWAG